MHEIALPEYDMKPNKYGFHLCIYALRNVYESDEFILVWMTHI